MGSVYKQQLSKPLCGAGQRGGWFAVSVISSLFPFLLVPFCSANMPECVQKSPCSCVYSDGSGYIDLHPVSRSDGKPYFSGVNILNEEGGLLEYDPCSSFSVAGSDSCSDVAICHKNTTDSTYCGMGDLKNVSFEIDQQKKQHYLSYITNQENSTVQTSVYLTCTTEKSPKLTAVQNGSDRYNLNLSSPSACVIRIKHENRGLSVGSWLCIIFASMTFGYFGTGVLYKRVTQDASGIQSVPHYEFWMELPSLIKDGYIFFISPCLGNDARYHAYRYEPL